MHLSSLLHKSRSTALEAKDPDNKCLEDLAELVREEGRLMMPRHQRRMNLIKAKRGQDAFENCFPFERNIFKGTFFILPSSYLLYV